MTSQSKTQKWADLLASHAASGLTKKAFCAQHNLNIATFYRWQRKLGAPEPTALGFVKLEPHAVHELTICLAQGDVTLRSHSTATLAELIIALADA